MIGKYPKCYNRYIINYKLKNVINKHKSNKIKENSNTMRHLNNGTDHRHSKSCCDQSSPARRTMTCTGYVALVWNIIYRIMMMMMMIMIIIITTTLAMTIMKMIMIKTAQTPCQSLYKDRRIQNKIAWYNWYNRDDVMLILYEMLHTCSIMHTQWRCKFENTKHRCLRMFFHRCNLHCSGRN